MPFVSSMIMPYTLQELTTKPNEKCSQTSGTFLSSLRGYSFHLCCFENLSAIRFAISVLKARLGGECCSSDLIMHRILYTFYAVLLETSAFLNFLMLTS